MFSTRMQIVRGLMVALVASSGFVMNGCKQAGLLGLQQGQQPAPAPNPNPNPNPGPGPGSRETTVTGVAFVRIGSASNLGNSRAALYRSLEEWYYNMPVVFVRVQGGGPEVAFDLSGLVSGTYFLDVWKDSDNSQNWTVGDFLGWYGNGALGSPSLTPLQVRDGQTRDAGMIRMYELGVDGKPSGM
jgi:hypothetical protein